MGKFSDILLTVDFDRTLTAPDSSIPEENLRAIEYFMAEGGAFTLNTGRSLPMVAELMDRIPVNAPLLLYNGSAAYDWHKQAFTFQHPIDLDWVDAVKRCRELLPELTVEIQGANAHYMLGEDPVWSGFTQANRCPWAYVTEEDVIDPFLKFTVYGRITQNNVAHLFDATPEEQAQIDEAEVVLNREFGEKTSIFRAARRIIDLHSKGVSKGRSARELQQKLGRKILVCVGDGENDLTMLDMADYAYCPADAVIRDRYENVCPCAEGAVADVIRNKLPEILK